jgi:hypothetical protein
MVHRRASLGLYVLFLVFGPIVRALEPGLPDELIPPLWQAALWIVPLWIFGNLRGPYTRILGYAWVLWGLIGSINVVASYLFYGDFYLVDAGQAQLIYVSFTTAFLLGMAIYERTRAPAEPAPPPTGQLDRWMTIFLLGFPFVWFASVYHTVGYIPVLLKVDISEDVYEIDYGPLYGLALLIAVSMLTALDLSRSARTRRAAWLLRGLVVFFGACSMVDSKRVTLMVFMMALFVYLIRVRGTRVMKTASTLLVVVATIGLYIGGQIIRKGADSEFFTNTAVQFSTVGVEYRDFVYSVNNFEPGRIPNYDFALSAIGAMINTKVLDAAGIDKQKLVEMGSAYAWKNLLGSDFGIRTGIVSELWFAYGWLGMLAVFAFGWISAWVSARLASARTKFGLVFMSVVYALLALSIVGQAMATTGALTLLFYAWVGAGVLLRLEGRFSGVTPERHLAGDEHARGEQAGDGQPE